jgi:hypothetical protein
MCDMSVITPRRPLRRHTASIPAVVVGTLLSLAALLTVQMSALTAYVDVVAVPGGMGNQSVDRLGRPLTGWAQTWANYGSALWAVYALVVLGLVIWMWRVIRTRPGRAVWGVVTVLVAASAVFWALNLDRFSLS